MPVVLVSITDSDKLPVGTATVEFFADVSLPATGTGITNSEGRLNIDIDPGTYIVRLTKGLIIKNIGKYIVKRIIPHHFSGIEMLTGTPGAIEGQFVPKRFGLTKYDHSNIGKTSGLSQKVHWRI